MTPIAKFFTKNNASVVIIKMDGATEEMPSNEAIPHSLINMTEGLQSFMRVTKGIPTELKNIGVNPKTYKLDKEVFLELDSKSIAGRILASEYGNGTSDALDSEIKYK